MRTLGLLALGATLTACAAVDVSPDGERTSREEAQLTAQAAPAEPPAPVPALIDGDPPSMEIVEIEPETNEPARADAGLPPSMEPAPLLEEPAPQAPDAGAPPESPPAPDPEEPGLELNQRCTWDSGLSYPDGARNECEPGLWCRPAGISGLRCVTFPG